MKFVYLLSFTLLISLSLQNKVCLFEICRSTCLKTRTNSLSLVDPTELSQFNTEWDNFNKCTKNEDGPNMKSGITQTPECIAYQTIVDNSEQKTDENAPFYRENLVSCYDVCGIDDFKIELNEQYEDCAELCLGELFSNPKVKEHIQCQQNCLKTFKNDFLLEYSTDFEGISAINEKIQALYSCLKNNKDYLAMKDLKLDYENEQLFTLQGKSLKTCLNETKFYKEDAGISFPENFNCIEKCANDNLGHNVNYTDIFPIYSYSAIIKVGFSFLAILILL